MQRSSFINKINYNPEAPDASCIRFRPPTEHHGLEWCLMVNREKGWGSSCCAYNGPLVTIFRTWAVKVVGAARDQCGPYLKIAPAGDGEVVQSEQDVLTLLMGLL